MYVLTHGEFEFGKFGTFVRDFRVVINILGTNDERIKIETAHGI